MGCKCLHRAYFTYIPFRDISHHYFFPILCSYPTFISIAERASVTVAAIAANLDLVLMVLLVQIHQALLLHHPHHHHPVVVETTTIVDLPGRMPTANAVFRVTVEPMENAQPADAMEMPRTAPKLPDLTHPLLPQDPRLHQANIQLVVLIMILRLTSTQEIVVLLHMCKYS